MGKLEVDYAYLYKDFELLGESHNATKEELIKLKESHEKLELTHFVTHLQLILRSGYMFYSILVNEIGEKPLVQKKGKTTSSTHIYKVEHKFR